MLQLSDTLESLKSKNYFEVLGVEVGFSSAALRKARRNMLTEYHSDKFEDAEDKKIAEDIGILVNLAYEALSDESFVEKYVQSNFTIQYSGQPTISEDNGSKGGSYNLEKKGMTLIAIASLTAAELYKGGKTKVTPMSSKEGAEPIVRNIKYPANTVVDSMIVYPGLGEEIEGGLTGDLIVHFALKGQKMNDVERILSSRTFGVVPVDVGSRTFQSGTIEIDASAIVGEPCKPELFKEDNIPHMMLIKSIPGSNRRVLLQY